MQNYMKIRRKVNRVLCFFFGHVWTIIPQNPETNTGVSGFHCNPCGKNKKWYPIKPTR